MGNGKYSLKDKLTQKYYYDFSVRFERLCIFRISTSSHNFSSSNFSCSKSLFSLLFHSFSKMMYVCNDRKEILYLQYFVAFFCHQVVECVLQDHILLYINSKGLKVCKNSFLTLNTHSITQICFPQIETIFTYQ